LLLGTKRSQKADGLKERESLHSHDEIDWIEVLAAPEAASEVCARIGCGVELAADRAEEAEVAVVPLRWDTEMTEEVGDVDLITEPTEFRVLDS
jgi:hypothetical protein